MYADDTLLIESGKTKESSIEACQEAMNEVSTWCLLNRLTINIDKTKCMLVSPHVTSDTDQCSVKIANTPLKCVHTYE